VGHARFAMLLAQGVGATVGAPVPLCTTSCIPSPSSNWGKKRKRLSSVPGVGGASMVPPSVVVVPPPVVPAAVVLEPPVAMVPPPVVVVPPPPVAVLPPPVVVEPPPVVLMPVVLEPPVVVESPVVLPPPAVVLPPPVVLVLVVLEPPVVVVPPPVVVVPPPVGAAVGAHVVPSRIFLALLKRYVFRTFLTALSTPRLASVHFSGIGLISVSGFGGKMPNKISGSHIFPLPVLLWLVSSHFGWLTLPGTVKVTL